MRTVIADRARRGRGDKVQLGDFMRDDRRHDRREYRQMDRGDHSYRRGDARAPRRGRGGRGRHDAGVPRRNTATRPPGPPPRRWMTHQRRDNGDAHAFDEGGSEMFARDSSPNDPQAPRKPRGRGEPRKPQTSNAASHSERHTRPPPSHQRRHHDNHSRPQRKHSVEEEDDHREVVAPPPKSRQPQDARLDTRYSRKPPPCVKHSADINLLF